jgi:N-acyl-D-amino-acid deacylase
MLDLALRGGTVVDGTGGARQVADVGILGGEIVALGRVPRAARELDVHGRIVAPGFIDPHSHSDWTLHANRDFDSTIRQGVTTEIVGNCGITNAPVSPESAPDVQARLASYGHDGGVAWNSFGEYLADVRAGGTSANLAFLVGHSTIREAAGVRSQDSVDEDQLRRMVALVEEALEAGAIGMSSGLEYSHGSFAATDELIAMAQPVGAARGIYASHIRNRDSRILTSVDEFLTIVRRSGAAGEISHLNVRHDTNAPERAWELAVEAMERAAADGTDVRADTTPFEQGVGMMTGILPSWLLSGGNVAAAEALADREVRRRLRSDCDRYWRFLAKGQWDRARLLLSAEFAEFQGLTFAEIADRRGQDPWDAYFDILQSAGAGMHNVLMVGDLFTPEHSAQMVAHPDFGLGVDAWSLSNEGGTAALTATPLSFAGHIHYLAHHVRDRHTLTLEDAVRKMTSLPAERFGLAGRGRVAERYAADLVVFDADRVASESTFANPRVYPTGIDYVIVNGTVVVQAGTHTGSRPGRVLRRTTP